MKLNTIKNEKFFLSNKQTYTYVQQDHLAVPQLKKEENIENKFRSPGYWGRNP